MAITGTCQYVYNPTERYQNRHWGESCGRETYAAYETGEEPEMQSNGQVKQIKFSRERDQADPYCPLHGGTRNPTDDPEEDNGDIFTGEEYEQFMEVVKTVVKEELDKLERLYGLAQTDDKKAPTAQKVVTKNAPTRNRGTDS